MQDDNFVIRRTREGAIDYRHYETTAKSLRRAARIQIITSMVKAVIGAIRSLTGAPTKRRSPNAGRDRTRT